MNTHAEESTYIGSSGMVRLVPYRLYDGGAASGLLAS